MSKIRRSRRKAVSPTSNVLAELGDKLYTANRGLRQVRIAANRNKDVLQDVPGLARALKPLIKMGKDIDRIMDFLDAAEKAALR